MTSRRKMTHHFSLILPLLAVSLAAGCSDLPAPSNQKLELVKLDQNWSDEGRVQFHHASQGTVMMDAKWFLALEQPEIKFIGKTHLFSDPKYLARFGFLHEEESPLNPNGLPVGLAVSDVQWANDGMTHRVVGLTCAACHTGQLEYQGKAIRIEGGGAMLDVTKFEETLGGAMLLTSKWPGRFDRFARRVLGEDYNEQAALGLKNELDAVVTAGLEENKQNRSRKLYDGYTGGAGRTDALAKIGNYVFGTELDDANLRPGAAPVKFPALWDAPWFDWTQYNGAIAGPMVRNIGEALGVRAQVNLDPQSDRYLSNTVDIEGLHRIENMLAGPSPLSGLHSPIWPSDVLGELKTDRVAAGEKLYAQHCQGCHLPPLQSDEIWKDEYWIANDDPSMTGGLKPPTTRRRYLNLQAVNLGKIGTDPGQATHFYQRYVDTAPAILPSMTAGIWKDDGWQGPNWFQRDDNDHESLFPPTVVSAGSAIQRLTVAIAQRYYDEQGFDDATRQQYEGYRNPSARNGLEYRPRPLNGIWASPPYLHNGSVRTLFQLLSPLEERQTTFYVGSREYDPHQVGYEDRWMLGGFKFDTRIEGNSNSGHRFEEGPIGGGIIGPALSVDDRYALIEYLKSLRPAGAPPAGFVP